LKILVTRPNIHKYKKIKIKIRRTITEFNNQREIGLQTQLPWGDEIGSRLFTI
jgi:hypothetical protein